MINNSVSAPVREPDSWFKSSFSNGSQTCVEVKFDDGTVLVRDSKDRRDTDRPIIIVTSPGWFTFLARTPNHRLR